MTTTNINNFNHLYYSLKNRAAMMMAALFLLLIAPAGRHIQAAQWTGMPGEIQAASQPGMELAIDAAVYRVLSDFFRPGTFYVDVRKEAGPLNILVVADDRYSAAQLEFMKELTMSAAKFNEARGDNIRMETRQLASFAGTMVTPAPLEGGLKTWRITPKKKLADFRSLLLVISSALLIFFIVYLAASLRRIYA